MEKFKQFQIPLWSTKDPGIYSIHPPN